MPLSGIPHDVLRVLASHRDPESYVAGAAALNRHAARYSQDIDVFHDQKEWVASAALDDAKTLEKSGYEVFWRRRLPSIYTAEVTKGGDATRLEWVTDSDFRFFPAVKDELFGYLLHPVDLATNKAMAAVGRRELRDIVDLVTVHQRVLPLGAVVWAAVEKSPGFTPEGLIAEIRRNSNYPAAEWLALDAVEAIDPVIVLGQLRSALDDAETFVRKMPTEKIGLTFIQGGEVTQPDPDRLGDYEIHAGARRGHWPSNPEVTAAMFERIFERSKG